MKHLGRWACLVAIVLGAACATTKEVSKSQSLPDYSKPPFALIAASNEGLPLAHPERGRSPLRVYSDTGEYANATTNVIGVFGDSEDRGPVYAEWISHQTGKIRCYFYIGGAWVLWDIIDHDSAVQSKK